MYTTKITSRHRSLRRLLPLLMTVAGLLSVCEAQAAKNIKYYTSSFRDAVVFRDKIKNGQLDPAEPSTTTLADGRFVPPKGKGLLYLSGGFEVATNQPNNRLLRAPTGVKAVGILTSLWQALRDRKQNPARAKKLLNMPSNTTVTNFAAVSIEKTQGNRKAETLLKRDAQQDTLIQFLKALSLGGRGLKASSTSSSRATPRAAAKNPEDPSIAALATALLLPELGKRPVDLADSHTVSVVFKESLRLLNISLTPEDLDLVVTAITELNKDIAGLSLSQQAFEAWAKRRAEEAAFLEKRDFPGLFVYLCRTCTPIQRIQALEKKGALPILDRSADLQGPDANADGIRDDVANYLASLGLAAAESSALDQLAKTIQRSLLVNVTNSNAMQQLNTDMSRAIQCVSVRMTDTQHRISLVTAVEKVTVNTKERSLQYIKFNNALSGSVAKLLTGNTCDN